MEEVFFCVYGCGNAVIYCRTTEFGTEVSLEVSLGDPKTGAIKGGFKETFKLALGRTETITNTSRLQLGNIVRHSRMPCHTETHLSSICWCDRHHLSHTNSKRGYQVIDRLLTVQLKQTVKARTCKILALIQQPIRTVYGLEWAVKMKGRVIMGVNPRTTPAYCGRWCYPEEIDHYYKDTYLTTLLNIAKVQSHSSHHIAHCSRHACFIMVTMQCKHCCRIHQATNYFAFT